MSNASKTTIITTSGTKLKAKAFEKVFGEEVVKTKVGWHRKVSDLWSEGSLIEELYELIAEEKVEHRKALNLSVDTWDNRAQRADWEASRRGWVAERSALKGREALEWKARWLRDSRIGSYYGPATFPSGEGGMLVAVALRRDGSVGSFLTLENWVNSYDCCLPEGFQFLN